MWLFAGSQKSDCFQAANFGGLIPTESCSFSSEKSYSPSRLICCQDTTEPFAMAWNRISRASDPGLASFAEPQQVLDELDRVLHAQYVKTNMNLVEGNNSWVKLNKDNTITISTPKVEDADAGGNRTVSGAMIPWRFTYLCWNIPSCRHHFDRRNLSPPEPATPRLPQLCAPGAGRFSEQSRR
jgi:hypothetical protein